jgi:hypothetical protein
MSQQEDFKKRAAAALRRAERESGPYREVLLGIGEAFAALAFHQAVLDAWPRSYPTTKITAPSVTVAAAPAKPDGPPATIAAAAPKPEAPGTITVRGAQAQRSAR